MRKDTVYDYGTNRLYDSWELANLYGIYDRDMDELEQLDDRPEKNEKETKNAIPSNQE